MPGRLQPVPEQAPPSGGHCQIVTNSINWFDRLPADVRSPSRKKRLPMQNGMRHRMSYIIPQKMRFVNCFYIIPAIVNSCQGRKTPACAPGRRRPGGRPQNQYITADVPIAGRPAVLPAQQSEQTGRPPGPCGRLSPRGRARRCFPQSVRPGSGDGSGGGAARCALP